MRRLSWLLVLLVAACATGPKFESVAESLGATPQGKARSYSTVHVLCVGVRSSVAPFFGLWLADRDGIMTVFAWSAALVALGCVALAGLARRTAGRAQPYAQHAPCRAAQTVVGGLAIDQKPHARRRVGVLGSHG